MTMNTRIAVTNRTICYELYKQADLASAEDTPLTCLSRQICALLNNNSYDKILVREKDLSEEEYHAFIADIFSAQHSYLSATSLTSNIIIHNFPAVAEEFGTDLHLPFSMFTSVATSDNDLTHGSTIAFTVTSSDSFRRKYPHIKRIGTSIHSVEDAVFAESHGADYITAGHIFTTDCKKGLPGRGVDWLKSICNAVSIPVYAIGGISDTNVSMLSDCNTTGYCMMSASMKPILSK